MVAGSDDVKKLRSPVERAIIELLTEMDLLHRWPPARERYAIEWSVPPTLKPRDIRYFLRSYDPSETDQPMYDLLDNIREMLLRIGRIDPNIFDKQYSSSVVTNHLIRLTDRQLIQKHQGRYSISIRSHSYQWDLRHIKEKVAAIDEKKICFVNNGMLLYKSKRLEGSRHIVDQVKFECFLGAELEQLQNKILDKLYELYKSRTESRSEFIRRYLRKKDSLLPSMLIMQPGNIHYVPDELYEAVERVHKEMREKYPDYEPR